MADQSILGIFDITDPTVFVFPTLDKPRAFGAKGKERGEPKFSGGFLFAADEQALKDLKSKAAAVARAKWPSVDFKTLKFPWENGDKRADKRIADLKAKGNDNPGDPQGFERGKVVLTARSKFRPRLAGLENGKIVDYDKDDEAVLRRVLPFFYFGVECFAQVNLVAYDPVSGDGKPGVAAYLNQVVSLKRGAKLAGGKSAAETFGAYAGKLSDVDPTGAAGGLDDDFNF